MKHLVLSLALLAALVSGPALRAQDSFRVRVDQPQHGKVTVTPAVPESGMVSAGTVLKVKVDVTDPGWVFDSGYEPQGIEVTTGPYHHRRKAAQIIKECRERYLENQK